MAKHKTHNFKAGVANYRSGSHLNYSALTEKKGAAHGEFKSGWKRSFLADMRKHGLGFNNLGHSVKQDLRLNRSFATQLKSATRGLK